MEQALLVWPGDEGRWELWFNGERTTVFQPEQESEMSPARAESIALYALSCQGWRVVCPAFSGYVVARMTPTGYVGKGRDGR
jgi:hypothetical protein